MHGAVDIPPELLLQVDENFLEVSQLAWAHVFLAPFRHVERERRVQELQGFLLVEHSNTSR